MVSHADLVSDQMEILAALRSVPGVDEAAVTEHAGADGRVALVGYVTGPDPASGTIWIRRHLATRLPGYLIPEHLSVLGELPLTPDGGYDLGALPPPAAEDEASDDHVAPRTPTERRLAQLVEQILGIDGVGIHDNFFSLGGSSVLAARLAAMICEAFDVELPLVEVLASPTVDELASLVADLADLSR